MMLRGSRWPLTALLLTLTTACGCSRRAPEQAPPSEASAARADAAARAALSIGSAPSAGSAEAPPAVPPWATLVRLGRHAELARAIDALPPDEAKRPELRFVRARAALASGDGARALVALEGLETELPLLAVEVAAHRLDARCLVGPPDEASRLLEARGDLAALGRAADLAERAGDTERALSLTERALSLVPRPKRGAPSVVELELRARRARVAEARGDLTLAARELRSLVLTEPAHPDDAARLARLAALAPKAPLGMDERFVRARLLARQGELERLERELALIEASAPPEAAAGIEALRIDALYTSRRDDRRAAELLDAAVKGGRATAGRDRLRAARALLRVGELARALVHLDRLAAGKSRDAESARFLAARARYLRGDWRAAARAYESYLKRHERGTDAESARHELAVALLLAGEARAAARRFAELGADAPNERVANEYRLLEGVALERAGDGRAAERRFETILGEEPLGFAALAARARLGRAGRNAPVALAPTSSATPSPLAVELPPKAALLARWGFDAEAERALGDVEAEFSASHAPRGDEALCRAYGTLDVAERRYRVGQRAVPGHELDRAPSEATRWMWECLYPQPFSEQVKTLERDRALPPHLLHAIMRQESGFRPSVVSSARAVGLMQLIPPTAESVAREAALDYQRERLTEPSYNLDLGSRYLAKLLGTFGGEVALAAAAYNAGPTAVSRWLETAESLPLDLFVAYIPYEETRHYVQRVIGNRARYAYLTGGEGAVELLRLELPRGLRAGADAY